MDSYIHTTILKNKSLTPRQSRSQTETHPRHSALHTGALKLSTEDSDTYVEASSQRSVACSVIIFSGVCENNKQESVHQRSCLSVFLARSIHSISFSDRSELLESSVLDAYARKRSLCFDSRKEGTSRPSSTMNSFVVSYQICVLTTTAPETIVEHFDEKLSILSLTSLQHFKG